MRGWVRLSRKERAQVFRFGGLELASSLWNPPGGGGGGHFGGARLREWGWGGVWRKGVQGSLLAPGDARLPTGSEWRMEANGTHRRVSWEQRLAGSGVGVQRGVSALGKEP